MSDLDHRLESLTDTPAPAMAPAALVRRRGEQRRSRTRLSVSVVGAALLVTGGLAYGSLADSESGRAVTQFANTPTPTPPVTSTPSPSPTSTPTPAPSVTSTPGPSPSRTEEPRETGLTSSHPLRRDGIGGVNVGMSVEEAQTAAGQSLVPEGDALASCVYWVPKTRDPAVWFMFIDGVLSRVDVESGSEIRTPEGIGIGSTEQQVQDAYPGMIVVKPSFYNPSGHDLHLRPDDKSHSMIFATDGVKVTSFRGGLERSVTAIEGCS